ncbi:amine oxidase, flavin-containing [Plesiocystis pacifica SIR-1]|uniref:Amine oxidase, flavin-containing n=1 Tax=Plesiocystis pacifica SIR-1 TaxID=391625 RepID=A6GFC3_9BACT|nr:FAD-dependent oxidoreductase [Plesiocystis pacifica]EDM75408.1 amine oxidase, flavin-containing [Plesiocystis pacifica SIR-1]
MDHQEHRNIVDVAVIGGGLAGLAAAASLGRAGLRVRCCERAASFGGRGRTLITETEAGRFAMNLGAHALYLSGRARPILEDLGVACVGGTPQVESAYLADGRSHRLPATPGALIASTALDLRGKLGLMRVFAGLSRVDPATLAGMSAEDWIAARAGGATCHRMLRSLFTLTSYSARLDTLDARAAVRSLQLALQGVRYIDGGWQALVEGTLQAARAHGVELRPNCGVRRLTRDPEGGWIVEAGDERWRARQVILALGPGPARRLLAEAEVRTGSIPADARAVHAACLELGLRGPWTKPAFALRSEPATYLSVHSHTAQDMAPKGCCALSVVVYLGREALDADAVRARAESMVDALEPSWRERVLARRFMPRMVVAHALPAPGVEVGTGLAEPEPAPGLHLVGDWVRRPEEAPGDPALLLDSALASAMTAVEGVRRTLSRAPSARARLVGNEPGAGVGVAI